MESSPNPTEISVSLGIYCKSSRLEIIFEYKSISNSKMFPIKLLFSLNRSNQNPQEVSLRYHPSHPIFCRWTNSKGGTLWSFNLRLGWHVATWLGRHHEDPPWILLFLIESWCDFSTDVSLPEGTVLHREYHYALGNHWEGTSWKIESCSFEKGALNSDTWIFLSKWLVESQQSSRWLSCPKGEGFLQLTDLVVGLCYVDLSQFQEFSGWTMRGAWCQPQTTLKTLGKDKRLNLMANTFT